MPKKTMSIILYTIFNWLAILSLGVFVYSLFIIMNKLLISNNKIILFVSGFLVLLFIILGKISLKRITEKTKGILPE